jgi:hypothetical protein
MKPGNPIIFRQDYPTFVHQKHFFRFLSPRLLSIDQAAANLFSKLFLLSFADFCPKLKHKSAR